MAMHIWPKLQFLSGREGVQHSSCSMSVYTHARTRLHLTLKHHTVRLYSILNHQRPTTWSISRKSFTVNPNVFFLCAAYCQKTNKIMHHINTVVHSDSHIHHPAAENTHKSIKSGSFCHKTVPDRYTLNFYVFGSRTQRFMSSPRAPRWTFEETCF